MNWESTERLLLLVVGAFVGVLSNAIVSWANERRGESRRKKVKLEEAHLAWLNTCSVLLPRLKTLTRMAEVEPDSPTALQGLLEKFESAEQDLQNLRSAVNAAFVYEIQRKRIKVLEMYSKHLSLLIERLNVVLLHHRTHLDFHNDVASVEAMISELQRMRDDVAQINKTQNLSCEGEVAFDDSELGTTTSAPQHLACRQHIRYIESNVIDLHHEAVEIRDRAMDHLCSCTTRLSDDAKSISRDITELEEMSLVVRQMLVA